MKNTILLLLITVAMSFTTIAQTYPNQTHQDTSFDFLRTIELEQHNEKEEIIIKIEKETKRVNIQISTSVSSGKLTIEIYDAKEKKQGTFSVGTQLNLENSELAEGMINKTLTEPEAGDWKIKIIPIQAKGVVAVNTTTFF